MLEKLINTRVISACQWHRNLTLIVLVSMVGLSIGEVCQALAANGERLQEHVECVANSARREWEAGARTPCRRRGLPAADRRRYKGSQNAQSPNFEKGIFNLPFFFFLLYYLTNERIQWISCIEEIWRKNYNSQSNFLYENARSRVCYTEERVFRCHLSYKCL